jgi:hypothetical protein
MKEWINNYILKVIAVLSIVNSLAFFIGMPLPAGIIKGMLGCIFIAGIILQVFVAFIVLLCLISGVIIEKKTYRWSGVYVIANIILGVVFFVYLGQHC